MFLSLDLILLLILVPANRRDAESAENRFFVVNELKAPFSTPLRLGGLNQSGVGSGERLVQAELPQRDTVPLRALMARHNRLVGSAVGRSFGAVGADGERYRAVLRREFSVLTAENDMKHSRLQPARGEYHFGRADSLVAFAEANGMKVRGHTLVWHRQLAGWLTSGSWTREQAIALLNEHIGTVAGRYRGRLAAWDVVNEAIDDDATFRSTFWSRAIGEDYIERAFRAARAADPTALLFYNDYNIEGLNPKSDSTYALLKGLLARGVPVQGIGFQGHFRVGELPARDALMRNFARFAALGLKIHITELDIRVPQPSTAADLQKQAQDYRDIFEVCLQTAACEMVLLWGYTDRDSWIPGSFPGWGDALIYDRAFQPKPAYQSIAELLAGK
jgi:endo-1,4-beta-xylanase